MREHGGDEPLLELSLVVSPGLQLLAVDHLCQLQHLPGQLEVGGLLLFVLLLGGCLTFLLSLGLPGGFISILLLGFLFVIPFFHSLSSILALSTVLLDFFLFALGLRSFSSIVFLSGCRRFFLIFGIGSFGFLFFQFLEVLFKGFGDNLIDLILLLVSHFFWVLELGSVACSIFLRDTLQSISKNSGLHPGELQQRLAVVEVGLPGFTGSFPEGLGKELAGLGQLGHGIRDVGEQKIPLASVEEGVGLLLHFHGSFLLHR